MYPEPMDGWMGGWVALEGVSFIDPSDFFHLFEQEKQNDTLLALLQGSGLCILRPTAQSLGFCPEL